MNDQPDNEMVPLRNVEPAMQKAEAALHLLLDQHEALLDEMAEALGKWLAWMGAVRFEHRSEKVRARMLIDACETTQAVLQKHAESKNPPPGTGEPGGDEASSDAGRPCDR